MFQVFHLLFSGPFYIYCCCFVYSIKRIVLFLLYPRLSASNFPPHLFFVSLKFLAVQNFLSHDPLLPERCLPFSLSFPESWFLWVLLLLSDASPIWQGQHALWHQQNTVQLIYIKVLSIILICQSDFRAPLVRIQQSVVLLYISFAFMVLYYLPSQIACIKLNQFN